MVQPFYEPKEVNDQTLSNDKRKVSIVKGSKDDDQLESLGECSDCVQSDVLADGYFNNPSFGHIEIVDSTNCRIGNNTFYEGPVTVLKQIVVPSIEEEELAITNDEPVIVSASSSPNKDTDKEKCCEKVCGLHLCPRKRSRRLVVLGITTATAGLVVTLAVTMTLVPTSDGDFNDNSTCSGVLSLLRSFDSSVPLDNDTICVCSRADWSAQPPKAELTMSTPVPYVMISHSSEHNEGCKTTPDCKRMVRNIQKYHIYDRRWDDIAYNFLIGGDGAVYEGRGWDKVGAHTKNWNARSLGICFIGNFMTVEPSQETVRSALKLIERGVDLGQIARDYKLVARCQVQDTPSPGERLFALMKKWPHWYNGTLS